MRRTHLKCNYFLKPTFCDGVQSILIPSKNAYGDEHIDNTSVEEIWKIITPANGKNIPQWDQVTDKESIEKLLLRWQQLHFLQANEMPLTSPEWKKHLDDPDFQNDVINGTYVPPDDLPQEVKDLFHHMKRASSINDLPFTSIVEDFKAFIKIVRKKQVCYPQDDRTAIIKPLYKETKNTLTQYMPLLKCTQLTRSFCSVGKESSQH